MRNSSFGDLPMTPSTLSSRPLRAVLGAALLLLPALPGPARSQTAPDPAGFAARLQDALLAGPAALDRLWLPTARDESRRLMDVRTAALFRWEGVVVQAESTRTLSPAADGAPRASVTTVTRGTATWRAAAWGVAQSFWTLQTDERRESNPVVRREEWGLEARDGRWQILARRELGVLGVLDVRLAVDAYPGQDALLVDGSYYVTALEDSVRFVRFLLDRRAQAFDFRVNGELVPVVRGNELGSLGLSGFSPELESSFALPKPLARGEEALVSFRLRSPLVHMSEPGFVTSLPVTEGAFRERLWIPVFRPVRADGPESSAIELTVRWPGGTFDRVGFSAPETVTASVRRGEEESSITAKWTGDLHDVDFALLAPGATLPSSVGAWQPGTSAADLAHVVRTDPVPAGILRAGRREREAVLGPLLATSYASRDLSTELQELLPLDDDLRDELFDDSATDAERGADDRSAN